MCQARKETIKPPPKFSFENITVPKPTLLKQYYWQSFDIDGLNKKLENAQTNDVISHNITIPTAQLNSRPIHIIFWLRNDSVVDINLSLKRVQNCACAPKQTRVGYNQFRMLYHCPHRRLIHITREKLQMVPQELIAMSVTAYFFLFGEHVLTYKMNVSDLYSIMFNFKLDVISFDPIKCILTNQLEPVLMHDYHPPVQAIWVHNMTLQNLNFGFLSPSNCLKILNPNLTVPHLSVWPLMVQFRPTDVDNEMELVLCFSDIRTKIKLTGKGILDVADQPESTVPLLDYDSVDMPYTIYPTRLSVDCHISEERRKMVHVHNFSQKCVQFRWHNFSISGMFRITFEPEEFRLKAHHSKMCIVNVCVQKTPLNYKAIPLILYVNRIPDKHTRIAREQLEEIESIDDPKWMQDTYITHLFLQLNLNVADKKPERVVLDLEEDLTRKKESKNTIFEKLFWEYLSHTEHKRTFQKIPIGIEGAKSYTEMFPETEITPNCEPPPMEKDYEVNKKTTYRVLTDMIGESLIEISKNWRFIPREMCEDSD